jgi:hypothetical protein
MTWEKQSSNCGGFSLDFEDYHNHNPQNETILSISVHDSKSNVYDLRGIPH